MYPYKPYSEAACTVLYSTLVYYYIYLIQFPVLLCHDIKISAVTSVYSFLYASDAVVLKKLYLDILPKDFEYKYCHVQINIEYVSSLVQSLMCVQDRDKMLESYVTPLLMSYVNKYIKNLKPSDLQLSLWGGDVVLSKLDLKLDVLEQVLFFEYVRCFL